MKNSMKTIIEHIEDQQFDQFVLTRTDKAGNTSTLPIEAIYMLDPIDPDNDDATYAFCSICIDRAYLEHERSFVFCINELMCGDNVNVFGELTSKYVTDEQENATYELSISML